MESKKKKNAKKRELEEDAAAKASTSLVVASSDDDEDANKDLSLEIVQKALIMRPTNSQNGAALDAPTGIASSEAHSEKIKAQKKKKRKKKLESGLQRVTAAIVEEKEAVETVKTPEEVEEEAVETIQAPEKVEEEAAEAGTVDTSDNVVLRKLLRGPRYFDPPSNSGWGTCYNCGEEGHAAVNCTAAKRKKPCFVCGSFEHNVKKCSAGQYCHNCKRVGHRAKNCPDKHKDKGDFKSLIICLKCGDSGHDVFLCKNGYSRDDLKEIQCYVCKRFGHLCCVNTTDAIPGEFSCYKCGQMGHTGLACSRLRTESTDAATPSSCYKCGEGGHFARECSSSVKASSRWQPDTTNAAKPSSCYRCGEEGHFSRECSSSVKTSSRWQTETTNAATPGSCYKCGEKGHFARECSSSVKVGNKNKKRKLSSTESPGFQKENEYMGYRSAPHDIGKASKKKYPHTEERGVTTPQKSNHRGGWMTGHPGEFSPSMSKRNHWRSPVTPSTSTNFHPFSYGSHTPSHHAPFSNGSNPPSHHAPFSYGSHPQSHHAPFSNGSHPPSHHAPFIYGSHPSSHHEISNSGGSPRTYNLRHTPARFGNSSSNGLERSYNGW